MLQRRLKKTISQPHFLHSHVLALSIPCFPSPLISSFLLSYLLFFRHHDHHYHHRNCFVVILLVIFPSFSCFPPLVPPLLFRLSTWSFCLVPHFVFVLLFFRFPLTSCSESLFSHVSLFFLMHSPLSLINSPHLLPHYTSFMFSFMFSLYNNRMRLPHVRNATIKATKTNKTHVKHMLLGRTLCQNHMVQGSESK